MKKLRLLLLLLLIVGLFPNMEVLAKTKLAKKYTIGEHEIKDNVGNTYYYSNHKDQMMFGDFEVYFKNKEQYEIKYKGKTYKDTVYFITLEDEVDNIKAKTVVFCIEPDKGAVYVNDTDEQNSAYTKLTDEQKINVDKIVGISTGLFAKTGNYDYLTSGQLLVWEGVGAEIISVPNSLNEEYEKIKKILDKYEILPSFLENQNITLEFNNEKGIYESYLIDTNEIFDDLYLEQFLNFNSKYEIKDGKDKNDIYIFSNQYLEEEEHNLEFNPMPKKDGSKNGINYKTSPIFINSGQDLVAGQSYTQQSQFKINTKQASGSVQFQVCLKSKEGCEPLSGMSYNLFDENNNLIGEATSNAEGIVLFEGLPFGNYYVLENEISQELQSTNKQIPVQITNETLLTLETIEYKAKPGEIVVNKYGGENKEPLKNVEFALYEDINDNGEIDQEDKVIDSQVTNEKGEAVFKKLVPNSYILKQENTADGYISNDFIKHINIKPEQIENIDAGVDQIIATEQEQTIPSIVSPDKGKPDKPNPSFLKGLTSTSNGQKRNVFPLVLLVSLIILIIYKRKTSRCYV